MLKAGNKNLQMVVILVITMVVTFNLKILWSGGTEKDDWGDMSVESDCEKPIIISLQRAAGVSQLNMSNTYLKWGQLKSSDAKVLAYHRDKPSFLTLGIPSIKRIIGSEYLMGTLHSIVEKTTAVEKLHTVIVVFLADVDEAYNDQVLQTVTSKYLDLIQMGFIHVVQANKSYYPSMEHVKRNFGDSVDRVKWRSKQVADFAFMFMYSRNLSQYYIQLEDDVICAPNFVTSIKKFIEHQVRSWAVLEFSELGFIGKLFKSQDLAKLAHFMLTFYQEQPADWLITYFRLTMTQDRVILRKPTLFQHMGEKSSFDTSSDNKLKDRFFDTGQRRWKGDDPDASLYTSMMSFDLHTVDLCYGPGSGFFWAKDPKLGDTIHIIFEGEYTIKRIAIETGNQKMSTDILHEGTVEISPQVLKIDLEKKQILCADPYLIGRVTDGKFDVDNINEKVLRPTKCITITVAGNQQNWIVFNQIAVFLVKEEGGVDGVKGGGGGGGGGVDGEKKDGGGVWDGGEVKPNVF